MRARRSSTEIGAAWLFMEWSEAIVGGMAFFPVSLGTPSVVRRLGALDELRVVRKAAPATVSEEEARNWRREGMCGSGMGGLTAWKYVRSAGARQVGWFAGLPACANVAGTPTLPYGRTPSCSGPSEGGEAG